MSKVIYRSESLRLEIVESKLFNQGEISVHGQLAYQDSVLSTVDPVLLLVGDSYITIDGQGNLLSKEMKLIADMERADIDLINSFPFFIRFGSMNNFLYLSHVQVNSAGEFIESMIFCCFSASIFNLQ